MEDFAFGQSLFEDDGESKQERRDKRIAERKRSAAGYVPRVDTPDWLEFGAGYVEKWLTDAIGEVPSHELRRLEAICSRLYYKGRYDDCLRAVVALMRRQAGEDIMSEQSLRTSDEQLSDLAMRSSLKCDAPDAIALGVGVAAASRHMWPVYAGLAISAAKCFERAHGNRDASKAYAAYLLIRGTNKSISEALLSSLACAQPLSSTLPDSQTFANLLSLKIAEAERLFGLVKRSLQLGAVPSDTEEQLALSGGRHDRSVRTL